MGCSRTAGESISTAEGVRGSIEYLLRDIEMELDGHTFTAPVAGAPTDFCEEIILGREVVFDLFDIEFKQADEMIIFKWRSQSTTSIEFKLVFCVSPVLHSNAQVRF